MDPSTMSRLGPVRRALEQGREVEYVEIEGQRFAQTRVGDGIELTALRDGDRELIEAWSSARTGLVEETRRLQARPPAPLTDAEVSTLREHGVAVFEGRFVVEAQPPVTDAELQHVERQLAGPIPEALVALWRTCFGGHLLYDLQARFEGVDEALPFSFTELYFPDSPHYHTLQGWMDHELELAREVAAERGEPQPDKLAYLPFGGFEYLERVYVRVGGEDHGAVFGWRRSLPPAWNDPLKRDSVTRLASDVRDLFRQLEVVADRAADEYGSPCDFLDNHVAPLRAAAGDALADRVRAHYLAAIRAS